MLILENQNFQKVSHYVKEKLKDQMYFSSLVATDFDLSHGDFFTIIPEGLSEDVIYNLDCGGYVRPFKRNENETIVKTENVSKEILYVFVNQYISNAKSNCLGIEDFSASPEAPYVKKSNIKYSIIGDRLFYLLDGGYDNEEITQYFNFASGYIFLGFLLSLDILEIEKIKKGYFNYLAKDDLNTIYKGIEGFFLEVYDGESYIFWIKQNRNDLLQLLRQSVDAPNDKANPI